MIEVKFYESVDDSLLKFAVIISKSNGKWVFCKHKERNTYEIPGGRREENETIFECAKRELYEETGAVDFDITPICVYSVTGKTRVNESGEESFGMLYFADIKQFEKDLHSEIEKVELFDELPKNWTYPLIQPLLIEEYIRNVLSNRKRKFDMKYRVMQETDIKKLVPLYIEYYNNHEDGEWTEETTYKRIHQVWSREDSLCFVAELEENIVGFVMGYFEQYDDIQAYDLVEIVVDAKMQNKGLGTEFMYELEKQVKANGGAMIQLQAVNDEMHEKFYGKLDYKDCTNLKIKSKWL